MRRFPLVAALLAGAVALVGCGEDALSPAALSVGGDVAIRRDDFEDELEAAGDQGVLAQLCQAQPTGTDGSVSTALSSCVLSFHAQAEVLRRAAAAEGVTLDEAVRAEAEEGVREIVNQQGGDPGAWDSLPQAIRRDLVDTQALAGGSEADPDSALLADARLAPWFEANAGRFEDVVCIDHILVETREQAVEVQDELGSGGEFAELAEARSIDTGSATEGGSLPCQPPESFVGPFADASREAVVGGDVSEPIQTQFGYHLLRRRELAFEQVDRNVVVARYLEERAGEVEVDGRYGRWDAATVSVLPPQGAADPGLDPTTGG